jgi:hypothetical protein
MANAIAGFFRTRSQGEAAQQALLSSGFSPNQVSFVAGDTAPNRKPPAIGPLQEVGAENEAADDAFLGGVVGLAAGMVAVAIPGVGPLIAAGPLAGAIGGLSIGAAAGGLIGLLRDHGISQDEAEFYAEGVKRGGSLVTVQNVSDDQASAAESRLKEMGAVDVEDLAAEHRK